MSMFIAEVIDDGMAYGKDVQSRLSSVASLLSGGGEIPIGAIEWRTGGDPSLPAVTGIAAPLLPYLGQVPLIGEYVLCFQAPSTDNNDSTAAQSYYYIGPIQIDNNKNYNETQGIFKRTGTPSPTIPKPLIPTFAKKNVPALQPLFGDTIIQDRNGSTIRMSSTQLDKAMSYMDSSVKKDVPYKVTGISRGKTGALVKAKASGNPIMQLTVGLPGSESDSITSVVGSIGAPATILENIDKDRSLIYLTSDQQLVYKMTRPFKDNSVNQPLTGGTVFKTDTSNQYADEGKNFIHYKNKKSISAKSLSQPGKKLLMNPHHGKGRFVLPMKYPSNQAANPTSQILMRSHRITLDAQYDSILMCALKDVKIGTEHWRIEMDSTMGLVEEIMKQVEIMTTHLYDLGNGIKELADINSKVQFPTGVGPTGPCLNAYKTNYDTIMTGCDNFLKGVSKRRDAINNINQEFNKMRRSGSEKAQHKSK